VIPAHASGDNMPIAVNGYSYVPGLQTGAAHIAGIRATLQVTEFWEEDPESTTTTLIARQKDGPGRLRLAALTNDINCSYSANGGVIYSAIVEMCGPTTTQNFNSPGYAAATDIAYVIETEDSFSVYTRAAGSNTLTTGNFAGGLGFGVHAGEIFRPDNRSDQLAGIGVHGMVVGWTHAYAAGANYFALNTTTTAGSQILHNSWGRIRTNAKMLNGRNTTTTSPYTALLRAQSELQGDTDSVDPLLGLRVFGVTSGTSSVMRYWRARNVSVSESDADGLVTASSTRVIRGQTWRHNAYNNSISPNFNTHPHNTVFLWAPTIVPVP
jgi:hypothetical protein